MLPEDTYLQALGGALYSFTYLEWGFIYIIQYLGELKITAEHFLWDDPGKLMAGRLLKLVKELRASLREEGHVFTDIENQHLDAAVSAFGGAKEERNKVLHAHPMTSAANKQRLSKDFFVFEETDLKKAARSFLDANRKLGPATEMLKAHLRAMGRA